MTWRRAAVVVTTGVLAAAGAGRAGVAAQSAGAAVVGAQDPAWSPKGLGFLYNNHLRSSRPTPGAYGSLLPLMRSTTGTVPTLVFAETDGGLVPRLAVGCAGNAWIPLTVYNVITNVIDGGLGAQAAIEAPRFLPGRDPADPFEHGARIEIEDRFPRPVLDDLQRRGHRFQKIGRKGEVRYGYASAVLVDVAAGTIEGGAEPRRSHAAVAAERAPASAQP